MCFLDYTNQMRIQHIKEGNFDFVMSVIQDKKDGIRYLYIASSEENLRTYLRDGNSLGEIYRLDERHASQVIEEHIAFGDQHAYRRMVGSVTEHPLDSKYAIIRYGNRIQLCPKTEVATNLAELRNPMMIVRFVKDVTDWEYVRSEVTNGLTF